MIVDDYRKTNLVTREGKKNNLHQEVGDGFLKEGGFEGGILKRRRTSIGRYKRKNVLFPHKSLHVTDCQTVRFPCCSYTELLLITGSGPNARVHVLLMTLVGEFAAGSYVQFQDKINNLILGSTFSYGQMDCETQKESNSALSFCPYWPF